jgi:predicted DsbA family dithiol-disulfide isomerase
MADRMPVEVWSDLVCSWCYLGKRRLEQALEGFEHDDRVDVVWRSFELEPDAPTIPADLNSQLVARYGMSEQDVGERNERMTALAAEAGLAYRLDIAQLGNTFDAHRLVHVARASGLQAEANERLLRACFSEGRAISDRDTLVELAAEAGVDAERARAALADGSHAGDVREDEREAAELGITGVPFFVLGRRYAVSGAQPAELLLQALERAWADTMADGEGSEPAAP